MQEAEIGRVVRIKGEKRGKDDDDDDDEARTTEQNGKERKETRAKLS